MRLRSSLLSFAFASSDILLFNTALAGDSVVIPLYSPNLPRAKLEILPQLITDEVDFSNRYDMVYPADARPKSLTPKCLKSVPCFGPIAEGRGYIQWLQDL